MKTWFIVAIALLLGACTSIQVRVIETQQLVLLEPDPAYLNDCGLEEPESVASYMTMSMDEREDILARTLIRQYQYTKDCTLSKRSLRKLVDRQKEIIADHNLKEAARIQALKEKMEKSHE